MGGRPNPNHGHRFAVLDGWRGIAALCVALYHFPVYSHIEFSGFVRGAYLFVDFFFVLSGFVIAYVYADRLQRWDDVTQFVVRRFGRLWPLHVATLLFLVATELAKLYAANRGWLNFSRPPFDPTGFNSWAAIPTNLVLIQALGLHGGLSWNGPAWSICTEFWTYLVFAALCWSGRRSLTLGAAACVAGGLLIVVFAGKGMNVSYDYGFFRCIFGFFTGYFVFRLWQRFSPQMRHWMGRGEIPAVGAVILFLVYASDNVVSVFAPFLFGPVVLVFAGERGLVSRALRWPAVEKAGAWSYSIYLTHVLVAEIILWGVAAAERTLHVTLRVSFPLLSEVPLVSIASSRLLGDALTLIYLAMVLAASALTYRFIEAPGRAFFNSLATRHRLQPAE